MGKEPWVFPAALGRIGMSAVLPRKSSSAKTVPGNDWESEGHPLLEMAAGNLRLLGDTGTLAWQEGADLTPWFSQTFFLGKTFIVLYFLPGKKHLQFTSMRCHSILNKKSRLRIFVVLFCTLPFFHTIKALTLLSLTPAPSAEVTNDLVVSSPGRAEDPEGHLHHCMGAHVLLEAGKSLENRSIEN